MVKFTITANGLVTSCEADGNLHPDLLDELSRRCVRLFVETNAALPDDEDE